MEPSGLARLEAVTLHDRHIREGLEALIEKERKLAELEILVRLSDTFRTPLSSTSPSLQQHAGPAVRSTASQRDGDATRSRSSDVAARVSLPSGLLRPRAGRAELSTSELALLQRSATHCGLDLSHMRLTDDSLGELQSTFQGMTADSASLRVLDLSHNDLGQPGAVAVVEALARFTQLEGVSVEGNGFGGKAGTGAVIDLLTRGACMGHIGVSINEAAPLPFSLDLNTAPPGLVAQKPAAANGSGGAKKGGKSKSPPKAKPAGKSKSPGKGGKKLGGGSAPPPAPLPSSPRPCTATPPSPPSASLAPAWSGSTSSSSWRRGRSHPPSPGLIP